jgi:multidrug efflux system membrane fusion protein
MSNRYTNAHSKAGMSFLGWAACAGLVVGLTACHRAAPPAPPPATVVALPVHPDAGVDGGLAIRYPVEAAARYANVMSFRVAGQIIERTVRLGDTVHRGQSMARLDPEDAAKQAASARSALEAAEHRLTFAKQQLDRDSAQFAERLIATSALEQTQDAYTTAQAARDQSANQWLVSKNALRYHTLIADHDGVVTSENADTGQFVAAGQAVYGLAWSGDIDVILDAAASDLGRIASGTIGRVTFTALPGRDFLARVREISPTADPQSRTYRVKLTLTPGADAVAVRLGMTGDASFTSAVGGLSAANPSVKAVFRIPAAAIFHRGSAPAVWVVRPHDTTLELRPVTVQTYTERAALVSAGLTEGDMLVLAGVHTVYAGQHVAVVKPLFTDESATQ